RVPWTPSWRTSAGARSWSARASDDELARRAPRKALGMARRAYRPGRAGEAREEEASSGSSPRRLVLPRRHDAVSLRGPGGLRHPPPLLLSAERRGGLRVGAVPDGRGGIRLVDPLDPRLVGEPHDLRPV